MPGWNPDWRAWLPKEKLYLEHGHSDFFAACHRQTAYLFLSLNYCLIRQVLISSRAEYFNGFNLHLLRMEIINEFHIEFKKSLFCSLHQFQMWLMDRNKSSSTFTYSWACVMRCLWNKVLCITALRLLRTTLLKLA